MLHRRILLAFVFGVSAVCLYLGTVRAAPKDRASADAETQAVAKAAIAFLNSLSTDQTQKVLFPFTPQKSAVAATFKRTGEAGGPEGGSQRDAPPGGPDMYTSGQSSSERPEQGVPPGKGSSGPGMGPMAGFVGEQYGQAVWSNYPVSDVPRPGLRMSTLTTAQRDAAMHLLQVALSPKGYRKVVETMWSDQALSDSGTPYCSGIGCYTIGIFGAPSPTKAWMLEFGGHHLGLNITMDGSRGVMTPTLTGAQPAVYTSNGKAVRALVAENDKAFALLDTLDDSQRKQAVLSYRVDDLVLGPGHAGQILQPEGLRAAALNEKQRAMLLDLISEWAGIVNDAYAQPRIEEIQAGLTETYFAWSGSMTHATGKNGSSYYRIQGPKVVIEFSPQGVGGDSTMHVHTMYRDPTNDYGIQFTGAQ